VTRPASSKSKSINGESTGNENWEAAWADRNLPVQVHDILAMMGEALHDTVQAPEIARNFGCLPERLLERIRQVPINGIPPVRWVVGPKSMNGNRLP